MVFTPFWCKSYTILVLWVGDGLRHDVLLTKIIETKSQRQREREREGERKQGNIISTKNQKTKRQESSVFLACVWFSSKVKSYFS